MLNRRQAVGALLAGAGGCAFAASESYPSRPVTLLAPAPAGGGLDLIARALADEMTKTLKQPVVVDSRPGAGGVLAANVVAKAQPDGHTVGLALTQSVLNNLFLMAHLPYDPRRDLAFVSEICTAQVVLVANSAIPATSVKELIAWMKANPSKAMYGSWGPGSYGHIAGTHIGNSRGVAMVHVPYKGEAPMVQDILGNQLPWAMASLASTRANIESGRLRALAITGSKRSDALPNVPTFAEAGLDDKELTVTGSVLLVAPAATPPAVLARLEKASLDALATPQVRARLQVVSFVPLGLTGKQARANYDTIFPVQEKLLRALNIKVD